MYNCAIASIYCTLETSDIPSRAQQEGGSCRQVGQYTRDSQSGTAGNSLHKCAYTGAADMPGTPPARPVLVWKQPGQAGRSKG